MEKETNISTQLYESNNSTNNNNQQQYVFNELINNIINAGDSNESPNILMDNSSKQMKVAEKCPNVAENWEFPLPSSSYSMNVSENTMIVGRECKNIKFPLRLEMKVKENKLNYGNRKFPLLSSLKYTKLGVKMKPVENILNFELLKHLQEDLKISENMRQKYKDWKRKCIKACTTAVELKQFPLRTLKRKNYKLFPIMNINVVNKIEINPAQKSTIISALNNAEIDLYEFINFKTIDIQNTPETADENVKLIKFPFTKANYKNTFKFPVTLIERSSFNSDDAFAAAISKSKLITSTIQSKLLYSARLYTPIGKSGINDDVELCSKSINILYEDQQFPVFKSQLSNYASFPVSISQFSLISSSILQNELPESDAVLENQGVPLNSFNNLNEKKSKVHEKLQLGMGLPSIAANESQETEKILEKQGTNSNSSSYRNKLQETEKVLEKHPINTTSSNILNQLQETEVRLEKQPSNISSGNNLNQSQKTDEVLEKQIFETHLIDMNSLCFQNELLETEEIFEKLAVNKKSFSNNPNELKETEKFFENQKINMYSSYFLNELQENKELFDKQPIKINTKSCEKQPLSNMNSTNIFNQLQEFEKVHKKQQNNINSTDIPNGSQDTYEATSVAYEKYFKHNEDNKNTNQTKFPLTNGSYENRIRFPISCAYDRPVNKIYDFQNMAPLSETKRLTNNLYHKNEIKTKEYQRFPILNAQTQMEKYTNIFPILESNSLIIHNVFKENTKISIDHDADADNEISTTMTQSCISKSYTKSGHDREEVAAAVDAISTQDHHLAQQVQTEITTRKTTTNTKDQQQYRQQKSNNCCVQEQQQQQHMYNDAVSAADVVLPTTAIIISKNINNIPEKEQKITLSISKNDESNNFAATDFSSRSDLQNIYDEEHQQQVSAVLEKATRITPPMSEDFIKEKQNISNSILKNSTTIDTIAIASSNSTNNNNNIAATNLENLNPNSHQQHSQLHSHSPKRSDVHDTSSHEELVQLVAVSAESGTRLPSSLPPLSSLSWSSSSFALTTHENRLNYNNIPQENSEYNLNNLEINEEFSDVIKKTNTANTNLEQQEQQQQVCIAEKFNDLAIEFPETSINLSVESAKINEMTVTKVGDIDGEDSEELNLSNNSLNDNQESIIDDPIDEMKFEMKSVKGTTTRAIPSSITNSTPSSLHMKNELNAINLPNITRSSSAAHIKNVSYSVDLPTAKYGVNVGSRGAATLPRLENEVSRSSSVDAISIADSVLPARTLLRRQRRLLSQESTQQQQKPEDKPEDPIERLNRLRARISGALSEVKGVLTKYSTEGEGEVEQTTGMGQGQSTQSIAAIKKVELNKKEDEDEAVPKKDDAAPVHFRFVRKVRRRSVFDEEEEDKESKDQVKEEAVESGNAVDKSSEESRCKEVKSLECKEVKHLESAEVKNLESNEVKNFKFKEMKNLELEKVKNQESKEMKNLESKEATNLKSKEEKNLESKEVTNLKTKQIKNLEFKEPNKHKIDGDLKAAEKELKKADKNNNEYDWKEAKNLEPQQAISEDNKTQISAKQTKEESENRITTNRERPPLKVLQKPSIENKKKFESEIVAILSRKSPLPEENSKQTSKKHDASTETGVAKNLVNKMKSSAAETAVKFQHKDETESQKETEVKLLNETKAHNEKTESATGVKLRKKLTVVKTKDDDMRRASIAAVEESKIEAPIEKEIPQEIKAQRRPSDSEVIIKKKVIAARDIIKNNEIAKTIIKTPAIKISQPQNDVTLPLDTVKEEKSSDESSNESKNKNQTDKSEVVTEATTKPKRRLTLMKTKNIEQVRRASIAAVEESQIEPPIEETKPLVEIKAQRRPSDSEAVVKRKKVISAGKATASGTNGEITTTATSSPKVKIITTKVRRTSLKGAKQQNELMKVNDKSSTAIDQSSITENTNRISCNKDATTTKTTSKTLPMQLAMDVVAHDDDDNDHDDDAIVNDDASTTFTKVAATAAVATVTISKNETTKDFRSATKLDDQSAAMVATLVSPLRTSESNSQQQSVNAATAISKTTITRAELAELVGETIIVVPTNNYNNNNKNNTDNNNSIKLKDNTKLSEVTKECEVFVCNQNEKTLTQSDINAEIPDVSESLAADIKELINQKIIPTKNSVNQKQEHQNQNNNNNQQVSTCLDIATVSDTSNSYIAANAESQSSLSAVNETHNTTTATTTATSKISTTIDARSINDEQQATETTKASNTPTTFISVEEIITADAAATTATTKTNESTVTQKMPELQVVPTPVKTVQIYTDKEHAAGAPFNDFHAQKKLVFKKIIRKNSIDKTVVAAKKKLAANNENNKSFDRESENVALMKISNNEKVTSLIETATSPSINESDTAVITDAEPTIDETLIETPAPPKKPRKVKKKVIIKRQQRKLSISDTFFREPEEPNDAKKLPEIETFEKPIEYVTDDEADAEEPEPVKVLKTCIKQREYQVGDWVMYGERFRKTQVRWKKGQIIERITSISYKINIDGQEVNAHISYIKKFTDRKVNFGGKEYLEIDYEQIAEEEKKARSYSIWNMV